MLNHQEGQVALRHHLNQSVDVSHQEDLVGYCLLLLRLSLLTSRSYSYNLVHLLLSVLALLNIAGELLEARSGRLVLI